jgi:hypothetical protein
LRKYDYTRLLAISTASYKAPRDTFSLPVFLLVGIVYLLFNAAYREINAFSKLIAEIPEEELRWTMVRVPYLGNGKAKAVKAGFVGEGVGLRVERDALAEWMVGELEGGVWVGKAPAVGNAQ